LWVIHCLLGDIHGTTLFSHAGAPGNASIQGPTIAVAGDDITLQCLASETGNPQATFYWRKNDSSIHTGSTLRFTPVQVENEGDYDCYLGNSVGDGDVSDEHHLTVYGKSLPKTGAKKANLTKQSLCFQLPLWWK
jgi:hypothetical protein